MPAILDFDFARPASYDPTDMVGVACVRSLASSAHPGTYVGQDGLIKLSPHNRALWSQDFTNAVWTLTSATVTADATVAPDGSSTADKLVEAAATANHNARQAIAVVSGNVYTWFVYAKAAERGAIACYGSGGMAHSVRVDLATGAVLNGSAVVTYRGNGWWKIACTATASATGSALFWTELYNGAASYAGDGTSGAYVWQAQLNDGPIALDDVKTTSAANGGTRIAWGPREPYQNLLLQTTWPDSGLGYPTGWSVGSGSNTNTNSKWGAAAQARTFTTSASRSYITQSFTLVSNTTYSIGIRVEEVSGTINNEDVAWTLTGSLPSGCSILGWYVDGVPSTSSTAVKVGTLSFVIGGTYTGASITIRFGNGCAVNTTGTVKLSRPNLNVGAQAFNWYPTTSAPVYVTPFDLVNNWECHGAMGEGTRTNALIYSQDLSRVEWFKSNITATAGSTIGPDGAMSGWKWEASTTAPTYGIRSWTNTGATSCCAWFVVKRGSGNTEANKFSLRNDTTATLLYGVSIDYSTNALTVTLGSGTSGVIPLGNGWVIVWLSVSSGISAGDAMRIYDGFTGGSANAGEYCYIYHGQAEVGATYPSSIIPTLGSAVTRNADAISYTLSGAHATALSSQGTVVVEYRLSGGDSTYSNNSRFAVHLDDGSTTDDVVRVANAGFACGYEVRDAASAVASQTLGSTVSVGVKTTAVVKWALNSVNAARDGILGTVDTSATVPSLARIGFGAKSYGGNELLGTVKRVTIFSTALTDTQITNASLPVAPTAHWRTLDGTHRMASDTDKTVSCDIECEANPNTAGENGSQRVEFYVSVNGVLSSIATQTARSERTHNSTPLGANTRRKLWSYGITLDLATLAGGTITVDATVFSNLGAVEYLPTLTLYNDTDGVDRRPNNSVVYYDYDLGDDTTGTGTLANPVKNLRAAMALLSGDVGGATIIALGRTVGCTPSSSYSAPGWYTSGKWALTVKATGADRTFRRLVMGTFSDPQDYILGTSGATLVTMRWQDFEFVGPGPAIYLSGPNARVDEINCTHRSNKYQPTDLIPHVDYEQYGSGGVGFELHGVSQARIYGWGAQWKGVGRGPQGYSGLFNFTIDKFLGIALGTSNDYGNNPCYTHGDIDNIRYLPGLLDGLIQTNLNFTQLAGVHVTVSVQASGPHTGKMRIDATDSTPNDFGTGASALVGSTRWGVTISSATSGANNGTFAALEGGTNGSGRPYCILDNASAVAEVGSAGFDMMTGTLVGGYRYIDVVHTDILQQSAPHTGAMFAHIRAYDCQNSRSWVGSGLAFERCVYKNLTDGSHSSVNGTAWDWGSGAVIARNCIFSFISLNGRANSFAGSWTGTSFVDCVIGDGSQFPTVGVFTHSCHFLTGATSGTNPSSGAWYAGEPGNPPFSFAPSSGNLGTASGLQDAPTFWRHAGASADSRGAWRNIATGNWSTSVAPVGTLPVQHRGLCLGLGLGT